MTTILHRAVALVGAALISTQAIAADTPPTRPLQDTTRSFDQALPVTPAQQQVDKLLRQIAAKAYSLQRHAEELQSFARGTPKLSASTHAVELNRARAAVNDIGADLRQLQALRANALPWQQHIIDRLEPLMQRMASGTTNAIELMNGDRRLFPTDEYRDAVAALVSDAGEARKLLLVHFDYAEAREKLNRLNGLPSQQVASTAGAGAALSPKPGKTLEQRVESALFKLPNYGVFDFLAFRVDGNEVTLTGDVSWPSLRMDAERAVRGVTGVERVNNHITVLPVSHNDDRIRLASYRAVYGHSALSRYRLDPNPPIRIIVSNGHLTLEGLVNNEMERTIATLQANSVPGIFSVTNNLQVGL